MKEIWLNVNNYKGYYQISNKGNVRSLDRYVSDDKKTQFIKGRLITPFDNGKGYMVVSLAKNGKRKNYYVHRLVGEHFLENYNDKLKINHKDFNTKNNDYRNLEMVTQQENIRYSVKNGRYVEANKEKGLRRKERGQQKILENEEKILNMYRNGIGIQTISKKLHLKYENVSKLVKDRMSWVIICVETNERFNTIEEANRKYGVTTIRDTINGRQKTSAGYHWIKRLEEYER